MSKVTLKIEIEEEVYKALLSGYEEPYSRMFSDVIKNATAITECDDCVSRQAVLDIAKSSKSNWIDNNVLFKRVNELPPVLPKCEQGEWINVKDRLPDKNTAVLTYINTGMTTTYCLAHLNSSGNWEDWIGYELIEKERLYEVLAWIPLPEPYRESEDK